MILAIEATIFILCLGTDRFEKTVDPDQRLQNAAADMGLHCFVFFVVVLFIWVLQPFQEYFTYI